MDGRNASGRIISLLNESSDVAAALPSSKIQLPPLSSSVHSRTSSCSASSTPSLSPQTPQLVRSASSDSRAFSTPSPLTPSYTTFEQATRALPAKQQQQQHYYFASNPYAKMDDPLNSMYPPLPDPSAPMPSAYAIPTQMAPQPQQLQQQPQPNNSNSPASEPSRVSTVSAQSNSKTQPKKNQYPCPMAKQVGCTDFFTTSGHAARHAKKHTGKKDALCPECNKAFTRKDNMEQHRRTHQNGRGSSRASDDSKVKKATKAPSKKSAAKPEPAVEAAIQQELANQAEVAQAQQVAQAVQAQTQAQQVANAQAIDQALIMPGAAGPYFLNSLDPGPIPSLPMAMPDLNMRPPLHRSSFASSLEFAPTAPMIDPDTLHYSYPSPGLSNGLNSLALAASEHRRMTEKSARSPSSDTSSHDTP